MSPTLHDALHLVNATDEESIANDLSPRDVANICDFVFGGDTEILLSSFSSGDSDSHGKKKRSYDDHALDPLQCVENDDARPRKKAMTMSRSYASLNLRSRVHLVRQESNGSEEDTAYNGLAANISDSFSSLSSIVSDLRSTSEVETRCVDVNDKQRESYGWFVQTEDESSVRKTVVDAYAAINNASSSGLAFAAPVAPMRDENEEKELAWCAAADTVDDVLADFF
mmetsp:Transcript_27128/g.42164  ORF Transcript_27128/g.42164 Transcript_27128/m.42164 type:complete len:226 (+) Transcript_27128:406-1083(+)|eukprot:CAMPEP_0196803540 /NCGR_PEP_ID=MMETSP1362-20130617/2954_1 /TAXON_ID=163516 /ORGANISM="Leptocylindrus danicus, Strain CCMP1856" /LENGTH=225 /DNA_ID=CAMNT_0042175195 /DNA_START=344 /DNA_END=1021 /DNA_ORIENTATION=+